MAPNLCFVFVSIVLHQENDTNLVCCAVMLNVLDQIRLL